MPSCGKTFTYIVRLTLNSYNQMPTEGNTEGNKVIANSNSLVKIKSVT